MTEETQTQEEQKPTVLISGHRPTDELYDVLGEHFSVAVFAPQAAQVLAGERGEGVTCPFNGAGPGLFDKSRNDLAQLAAQAVDTIQGLGPAQVGRAALEIRDWLPGVALGHLTDALTHLRVLDAYAETVQPVVVVTHEDVTPVFRAVALWAKARGIPTIHMPHGNCFAQVQPDIHDESVCDWLLAASPYMRDWYVERGFSKRRVRVVGFPAWDQWAEEQPARDVARRTMQLVEDRPVVAFCTGWAQRTNFVDDHDLTEAAAHVTLDAARSEGWQVVWKLHPGDAQGMEERAARMAAGYRVPALVTRDHLRLVLAASDVVLSTGPSNVLVEAGLADRPPALFDLRGYGFDDEPPWRVEPERGSVVDTVAALLDGALWEETRAGFVGRYAFKNDGRATERAVRQIRMIAGGE